MITPLLALFLLGQAHPCDITSLGGDCGYLFGWPHVPNNCPYPGCGGTSVPLAKSLADNGWDCVVTETKIHCTKGNK